MTEITEYQPQGTTVPAQTFASFEQINEVVSTNPLIDS